MKTIDKTKVDNIEMEDIDHADAPDFCNAFIASADINGRPMTDRELDILNDDSEFVYESLMNYLY